jgi:hypothetical protein
VPSEFKFTAATGDREIPLSQRLQKTQSSKSTSVGNDCRRWQNVAIAAFCSTERSNASDGSQRSDHLPSNQPQRHRNTKKTLATADERTNVSFAIDHAGL